MDVRILVLENDHESRNLVSLALRHLRYAVDFAVDSDDACERLREAAWGYAAIVVDLEARGGVVDLLSQANRVKPAIPVIGLRSKNASATRPAGIDEIISKPLHGSTLQQIIQRLLDSGQPETGFATMMETPSSAWRSKMRQTVRAVASGDVPVLLQGETGTGKEVLAREIHALSARAKKPFLKINCAALPSELVESELFGYEKGAFTGAFKTNPGKFAMADGGSILLDEIGDMDFKLQAKLLQVLQEKEFLRLGTAEPRKVDVRIIAATHCNLEQAIIDRGFREDLYYRLNVVNIEIPPLRERTDEILPLAYHFLRKYSTTPELRGEITGELRDALLSHDWPGNVRELENVMRRLLVFRNPQLLAQELRTRLRRRPAGSQPPVASDNPLRAMSMPLQMGKIRGFRSDLPAEDDARETLRLEIEETPSWVPEVRGAELPQAQVSIAKAEPASILGRVDQARREAETEAILAALNSTLWNRKRAAELLQIDYKALLYKMKKLGLQNTRKCEPVQPESRAKAVGAA